jgi:hypothetical protein
VWFSKNGQRAISDKVVRLPPQHRILPSWNRPRSESPENAVFQAPVDKPRDIHSILCEELINLSTGKFLSNKHPARIQSFSGHL